MDRRKVKGRVRGDKWKMSRGMRRGEGGGEEAWEGYKKGRV